MRTEPTDALPMSNLPCMTDGEASVLKSARYGNEQHRESRNKVKVLVYKDPYGPHHYVHLSQQRTPQRQQPLSPSLQVSPNNFIPHNFKLQTQWLALLSSKLSD
jgi:hypothetical protein